ncbi:hypothetical protein HMPREF1344_02025 [Enterococcus faecalis R508]|nr:hypothetical protein HMPREF1344_02025 [Enterococcus faecalis R508]
MFIIVNESNRNLVKGVTIMESDYLTAFLDRKKTPIIKKNAILISLIMDWRKRTPMY